MRHNIRIKKTPYNCLEVTLGITQILQDAGVDTTINMDCSESQNSYWSDYLDNDDEKDPKITSLLHDYTSENVTIHPTPLADELFKFLHQIKTQKLITAQQRNQEQEQTQSEKS